MRKKRKGSETQFQTSPEEVEISGTRCSQSSLSLSAIRSHYSLEDYSRLNKKRCKQDIDRESLIDGVATASLCGGSSLASPARGLKRKIGCIDTKTQLGRKNKIEDDYVFGDSIGKGKFGSVRLCKCRATGAEFACKTL
ncbi:hypothetical protein RJ641_031613 [Dillenia turbinata]|uniref:Uncharacterized protein n=1 Tax=Dillenia turbinata TaxID=194707 RepID=A0AAN8VQ14_9MAGN